MDTFSLMGYEGSILAWGGGALPTEALSYTAGKRTCCCLLMDPGGIAWGA